jgi:rhodanese-related sulfurtransferase
MKESKNVFYLPALALALVCAPALAAAYDAVDNAVADTSSTVVSNSFPREDASRPCPPSCATAPRIDSGISTVGELEVINFIQSVQQNGNSVLIDARPLKAYQQGTIAGSVNIPVSVLEQAADDPALAIVLESFGGIKRDNVNAVARLLENMGILNGDAKTDQWDFSTAKQLLLWCDAPRCEESPRAIRALLALGYPADKLFYYRGGMQMWQSLGLETVTPTSASSFATK